MPPQLEHHVTPYTKKVSHSLLLNLHLIISFSLSVQSKYDVGLSTSAMYYAASAYCDPLALLTWSCGRACGGNSGIFTVRRTAYAEQKSFTYGYVTYNPLSSTIVVAFRGTNGLPTSPTFRMVE